MVMQYNVFHLKPGLANARKQKPKNKINGVVKLACEWSFTDGTTKLVFNFTKKKIQTSY